MHNLTHFKQIACHLTTTTQRAVGIALALLYTLFRMIYRIAGAPLNANEVSK